MAGGGGGCASVKGVGNENGGEIDGRYRWRGAGESIKIRVLWPDLAGKFGVPFRTPRRAPCFSRGMKTSHYSV